MAIKFCEMSALEKSAVTWHVLKIHDEQASRPDGAGIYARNNRDQHIANLKEAVATGGGVKEIVSRFQREAIRPPDGAISTRRQVTAHLHRGEDWGRVWLVRRLCPAVPVAYAWQVTRR